MADSVSKKSEAQSSKPVQSQIANKAPQPKIGDLSAIQSEIDKPTSNPHSIGDMENIDAAANSDVLGDITLLEEAFAEMGDSPAEQDDEIPMLQSTIEQPSVNPVAEAANANRSIPVLDQQPTAFVDNSTPAANTENSVAEPKSIQQNNIPTLDKKSDLPKTQVSEFVANTNPIETPTKDSPQSEFSLSEIDVPIEKKPTPPASTANNVTSAASEFSMSEIENIAEKNQTHTSADFSQINEFDLSEIDAPDPVKETVSADVTTATNTSSNSEFTLSALDNPAELTEEPSMTPVVTTFDAHDENLEAMVSKPASYAQSSHHSTLSEDKSVIEPPAFSPSEPVSTPINTNSGINLENSTPVSKKITLSSIAEEFENSVIEPSTPSSEVASGLNATDDIPAPNLPESTIEEKIARATGDNEPSQFNDIPMANSRLNELPETELAPGFVEDISQSHFSTPVGELVAQKEEISQISDSDTPVNMSIPFELHSQLSKKIDELVLDATMSLTNELQTQLSLQLESLLGNAVEAVLPKLVDQMANELRSEVKNRVKRQLPSIVNDVLGKTRLS